MHAADIPYLLRDAGGGGEDFELFAPRAKHFKRAFKVAVAADEHSHVVGVDRREHVHHDLDVEVCLGGRGAVVVVVVLDGLGDDRKADRSQKVEKGALIVVVAVRAVVVVSVGDVAPLGAIVEDLFDVDLPFQFLLSVIKV